MSGLPAGYGESGPGDLVSPDPAVERTLRRPHVFLPGAGSATRPGVPAVPAGPPLLLLHPTGGNENDLLHLGRRLSASSPLLSPRGLVTEHGMPRFFRRHAVGVADEVDLAERADALAAFVAAATARYRLPTGQFVAVGFSSGANTASALALRHPGVLRAAVLIAATPPFAAGLGTADLTGLRVLVVNGRHDPLVAADQTAALVCQLRAAGAEATREDHDGGHTIPGRLVPTMAAFVSAATATTGVIAAHAAHPGFAAGPDTDTGADADSGADAGTGADADAGADA